MQEINLCFPCLASAHLITINSKRGSENNFILKLLVYQPGPWEETDGRHKMVSFEEIVTKGQHNKMWAEHSEST